MELTESVTLRVQTEGTDQIDALQRKLQRTSKEIDNLRRDQKNLKGSTDEVRVAKEKLGAKIDDLILKKNRLEKQTSKLSTENRNLTNSANAAGVGMSGMSKSIVAGATAALASMVALHSIVRLVTTSLAEADETNNQKAWMRNMSSSAEEAVKSLAFFDEAQKRTRTLGDDLIKVYAELLPLAMEKGFSEARIREMTVQLDQVATATGRTFQEMEGGMSQLMSGRISGKNPLLRALGLDAESLKDADDAAEQVIAKMTTVAAQGEAMGDNFASTGAKIKDAIITALGDGINEGKDEFETGLESIKASLTSPAFLDAIKSVGSAIAAIAPMIVTAVTVSVNILKGLFGVVQAGLFSYAQASATAVKWLLDQAAAASSVLANLTAKAGGVYSGLGMNAQAGLAFSLTGKLNEARKEIENLTIPVSELKVAFAEMADAGADKVVDALNNLKGLGNPVADSLGKVNEVVKAGIGNFKGLGDAADKAAKKVKESLLVTKPLLYGVMVDQEARRQSALQQAEEEARLRDQYAQELEADLDRAYKVGEVQVSYAQRVGQILEESTRKSFQSFTQLTGDILSDVALTGGKNFGEIAGQTLNKLALEGADLFAALIGSAFGVGGGVVTGNAKEGYLLNGKKVDEATALRAKGVNNKLNGAVQGAAAAYGIYQQAQAGSMTPAQGAISGALTGASIGSAFTPVGTVVGAVLGLVVGALAAAIGSDAAKKKRSSGTGYFDMDGQAHLINTANVSPNEQRELEKAMQTQFDTFWNSWVKIAVKIGSIIPKIGGLLGLVPVAKTWMEEFQGWIANGITAALSDTFKKGFGQSFEAMGVTKDAFEKYWKQTENMDPKDQIQFWSDMFDALESLQNVQTRMTAIREGMGQGGEISFNSDGTYKQQGINAFMSGLSIARTNLTQIATTMLSMTGPQKIAAFKELGTGLNDLVKSLQEFVVGIARIRANLKKGFGDDLFAVGLEREESIQGKKNLLYGRYEDVMKQIQMPGLDPAEIERLANEGRGLLREIYNLDPTEEAYAWYKDQMAVLATLSDDLLKGIGEAAISAVDQLIKDFQPFITTITTGGATISTALDDTSESVIRFGGVLDGIVTRFRNRDTGGSSAKSGETTQSAPAAAPINITITGDNYGLENLVSKIESGLRRKGALQGSY